MSRSVALFLLDLADAGERALAYTYGQTFDSFVADRKTVDATQRCLEIVGEAAKHVSEEMRATAPQVDWRGLCELRDIVAHSYFACETMCFGASSSTKCRSLSLRQGRF